jgi:hypothetical protein
MALANLMRLSLRERRTRDGFWCCVAGNPGRDDKGEGRASIRHLLRHSALRNLSDFPLFTLEQLTSPCQFRMAEFRMASR